MTKKHILAGMIVATATLGLIVPRIQGHADAAADLPVSDKQQVQVKFEWVKDQSPDAKTLTLSTSEDTTGTVTLEQDKPGGDRTSATIIPHINADHTVMLRFNVDYRQSGSEQRLVSKRSLKLGERTLIGGLLSTRTPTRKDGQTPTIIPGLLIDAGNATHAEQVFVTATLVPADDGKIPMEDMPTRAGGF